MLNPPANKADAARTRYGNNSIYQDNAYDPERCAYEVWSGPRGMTAFQCKHKPGHGPDKLYCKQHAARLGAHHE